MINITVLGGQVSLYCVPLDRSTWQIFCGWWVLVDWLDFWSVGCTFVVWTATRKWKGNLQRNETTSEWTLLLILPLYFRTRGGWFRKPPGGGFREPRNIPRPNVIMIWRFDKPRVTRNILKMFTHTRTHAWTGRKMCRFCLIYSCSSLFLHILSTVRAAMKTAHRGFLTQCVILWSIWQTRTGCRFGTLEPTLRPINQAGNWPEMVVQKRN